MEKKKKKTLVLTLGRSDAYTANPPEKGGKKNKKKTLVLTLGSLPKKGEKKFKNKNIIKNLVLTLGSPPEKGEKKKHVRVSGSLEISGSIDDDSLRPKKKKKKTLVLTLGRPSNLDFRT